MDFPASWDVTLSPNYWYNEITMDTYIRKIICPHIQETRERLKLATDHRAFYILKAQSTDRILELLKDNNIVFVPANCTDELQPMDLL